MTQQESDILLQISDLTFRYNSADKSDLLAIPQWQMKTGQRLFLYGPSGSGKSTLLNLLAGTLKPVSGSIEILGNDITRLSARKRDKFRAKNIGVVFQQFNLIPYLTVEQNIATAAWLAGNSNGNLPQLIAQTVTQLQLPAELLKQQASQLSVGQQQRVAIARALINHPKLMIVDEPTSALDSDARDSFMQLLLKVCDQENSTLIFVSHDQSLSQYFEHKQSLASINQAYSQKVQL